MWLTDYNDDDDFDYSDDEAEGYDPMAEDWVE
jgi:hypothetical protein